jgi:hypothetical protein
VILHQTRLFLYTTGVLLVGLFFFLCFLALNDAGYCCYSIENALCCARIRFIFFSLSLSCWIYRITILFCFFSSLLSVEIK